MPTATESLAIGPHLADIAYYQGGYRLFGWWWNRGPCHGDYQACVKPSRILGKTPRAVIRSLRHSDLIWAEPVKPGVNAKGAWQCLENS